MARPLRYEAAGAVYHVMARGDGGKNVIDDDKDRFAWTDLMEKARGRFGWRVHAWVLMGNHFHLLLETPEPNLVAGMKWVLGVFSQGWNRRRGRRGHVFQGRYKTVVVNGEAADGSYFKIVADYIHLNPVRSGWVGGEAGGCLRSWRWRKDETELVAALVRKRTAMPNRWVASRLGMGHEVGVTRAVRRFRDDRKLAEQLKALEKNLEP